MIVILCEHSWPLLHRLWKRIYCHLITKFLRANQIFLRHNFCTTINNAKTPYSHLYASAMSLSSSSFCFFCHQRIGRIRFLPCSSENVTLVWQNNETGVTQGKMNMHVCHTFCFSRTVTRLRKMQVSMRTKVFTFPTGQNKVAKDWQQIANSDEMSRQFNLLDTPISRLWGELIPLKANREWVGER